MYKYFNNKSKKGDISLLVTLLVCSILLILLAPIAQKVSVESNISKENLMSQQAAQAAKTGLDAWLYNWLEGKIDETSAGGQKNWPNGITPLTQAKDGWIILDSTSGIQYQVKFEPRSGSTPARIISTGRVNRDGFTIERILEDERKDL
jgi:type II secretory pathway pseudopilin PulG